MQHALVCQYKGAEFSPKLEATLMSRLADRVPVSRRNNNAHSRADDTADIERRIGALQDEVKQRDLRIEELRQEVDEQRDLIRRMEEHVEEAGNVIERWAETFDMVMSVGVAAVLGEIHDLGRKLEQASRGLEQVRRVATQLPQHRLAIQPLAKRNVPKC